jgi:sigma-B regulation protein RsbU (phosphoserine phosphatase)
MRLIVTVVTAVMVAGAVIGVGAMAERNVRNVLAAEVETRLVLEARNLAMVSSSALLSDYPELTLHPLIKGIEAEREDLSTVLVVDRDGIIQGHADAARLGQEHHRSDDLAPIHASSDGGAEVNLEKGERLFGNDQVLVVETPIRHPGGGILGTAIVAVERSYIDALVTRARRSQIAVLILVLAASMILTPIVISLLLRPIAVLRAGIERIGRGDLDGRLHLSSRTELGALADSVNDMAARLKAAQIDLVEKERLDHEMDLAREIQRSLLPGERLEVGKCLVTGSQKAAEEVGGDYYDVFDLEGGRVGLLVADVAGKGLSGCLVTSMLAVLVRTLAPSHASAADLLVALQDSLAGSLQPGTFVTMFYGILDADTGRLDYASAGHNPVLQYVATEERVVRHDSRGIPLGLIHGDALRQSLDDLTLTIAPGDVLVQYTDGFHEAVNAGDEEFGLERMIELVAQEGGKGNESVRAALQRGVERWEGARPASDDKTLLVVSRCAAEQPGDALEPDMGSREVAALWECRPSSRHHLAMPATLDALDGIGVWLRRCTFIKDLGPTDIGAVEQGLYEVAANIVEHGYAMASDDIVDIWWVPDELTPGGGNFLVRDHGSPPDPRQFDSDTLDIYKVRTEGRGLGLRIINQTFDRVELYPQTRVGNLTVLRYGSTQTEPV